MNNILQHLLSHLCILYPIQLAIMFKNHAFNILRCSEGRFILMDSLAAHGFNHGFQFICKDIDSLEIALIMHATRRLASGLDDSKASETMSSWTSDGFEESDCRTFSASIFTCRGSDACNIQQLDTSIDATIMSSIRQRVHLAMQKRCALKVVSGMLSLCSLSGRNVSLSVSRFMQLFDIRNDAMHILSIEIKRYEIHNDTRERSILEVEIILTPQDSERVKRLITQVESEICRIIGICKIRG